MAKQGGKGKGKNSWQYSAAKGNTYSGSPGGKGNIQAKAGTRKEVTAGQVESRRESVAIAKVEKEAKAARACTGLTLYQKTSVIGMVVLRRHPPCSIFEASKLTGPPGLPVRNRFQELASDDESEGETHLQQQVPCCSPTTAHDEFGIGNKRKF